MASVSVIMPVFNGARFVAEAIDDVLAQTHPPIELIVVDDGSTDETVQIVQRYSSPLRLVVQEHAGCGAARNAGVDEARGDVLVFCDADDRFPVDRIERQLDSLNRTADLDAVFGELEEFMSPEADHTGARLRTPVARRHARVVTTMLIRTESFLRVGPFATDLGRGVDIDWMARANETGLRSDHSEGLAVRRRLHHESTGIRRHGDEDDYVRAVRAAIARRRQ
jgi:glycosyltransferase involved in cell wall biosynthesis